MGLGSAMVTLLRSTCIAESILLTKEIVFFTKAQKSKTRDDGTYGGVTGVTRLTRHHVSCPQARWRLHHEVKRLELLLAGDVKRRLEREGPETHCPEMFGPETEVDGALVERDVWSW